MAKNIFDQFLSDESTLYKHLDPTNSKSSIRSMFLKLKNDDRQVDIITLYKIAASSIPNLDLKDSALNYIKKCSSNPANIFWKCLIQPVIVLSVYYGLLRHGITLSSFINYQLSAMSSMRLTHMFVNIVSHKDRGLVTYRFVAAILQGKLPSVAADIALKGFDPTTLFNTNFIKKKNSKFNDKKQEFRTRSFPSSTPFRVTDSSSNSTQNKNNNYNSVRVTPVIILLIIEVKIKLVKLVLIVFVVVSM